MCRKVLINAERRVLQSYISQDGALYFVKPVRDGGNVSTYVQNPPYISP
jgi:hypothetical protein